MATNVLKKILADISAGRLSQARSAALRLYAREPNSPQLNALMASLASQESNWQQVYHYGSRSLALGIQDADLYNSVGVACIALDKRDEGEHHFRQAVALNPHHMRARSHLGTLLLDELRACDLETASRDALEFLPGEERFVADLATALFMQLRPDRSIAELRAALFRRPTSLISGQVASQLNYLATATPQDLYDAATSFGRVLSLHAPVLPKPPQQWGALSPTKKLRLGLVSADLRLHSVSYFLLPLLESLDPAQFELYMYSNSKIEDGVSQRYRRIAACWRRIAGIEDGPVAAQIRTDAIDVAFDLSGNTADHRLGVFGARVAPLQVSFIGSPATTGMKEMDVRIVDHVTDPPQSDALCTERLVRLDPPFLCYQPPEDAPLVSPPPCLATNRIAFGSFNAAQKYNEPLLKDWVRILAGVPGSVLILKAPTLHKPQVRLSFLNAWNAAGGNESDVHILGYSRTAAEHLSLYSQIDIGLDPHPYHGTTTTCEALYMGVPVVSRIGTLHVSRVGASLLRSVGLPELACADSETYVATAIDLANSPRRLQELRASMRARMSSELTNAPAYASRWSVALRAEWNSCCERWRSALR